MVQTQLASMYIGNPYALDAEDRLQGVSSKVDATIHILDGQSNQGVILDYITAKNIISDAHKKSLEDTLETYNFITFADKRFSEYLEKRNRFIIPDEDGTSREFVMYEGAKYKDSEGYKAQVFAHASYLELKKATVLYPESYKGTASQHTGRTLNDTGWQVGIVEVFGNKTLSRSKHTNPYEFLKHIAKEYGAELKFRVEHDGNKIVGRYVDLLERVGDWRGREVVFGKDLDGIRRVEKQNIVTALLGLGPEDEDGNRIEVLVEDEDALKRWGRVDEFGELHHLIEAYEIQSEREDMTIAEARQYTRTALNKRINESVTYECSIIDLENVPDMVNKKIRHGDTIRIKDEHFNPPLYLEARVFEFDRSIKSSAKKDIKLGDFTEFTEEEVNAVYNQIRQGIFNNTYTKETIDKKDRETKEDADEYTDVEIDNLKNNGTFPRIDVRREGEDSRVNISPSWLTVQDSEAQTADRVSSLTAGDLQMFRGSSRVDIRSDEYGYYSRYRTPGGYETTNSDASKSKDYFNRLETDVRYAFGKKEVNGWTYHSHVIAGSARGYMETNLIYNSGFNHLHVIVKGRESEGNKTPVGQYFSATDFLKLDIKDPREADRRLTDEEKEQLDKDGIDWTEEFIDIKDERVTKEGVKLRVMALNSDGNVSVFYKDVDVDMYPTYKDGEHIKDYWLLSVRLGGHLFDDEPGDVVDYEMSFIVTTNVNSWTRSPSSGVQLTTHTSRIDIG